MTDAIITQVTPNSTALSAEHYQTFEMAKANDGIIGGDDIARIRDYAAFVRAKAQSIHKTIAATNSIDDVVTVKKDMTESEQTFAKIGIYCDQRIGEILRELPTKQGARNDITSVGTPTKVEAEKQAGVGHATAIDLQKLAANPEVVEAVIAKATEEGRIVSRKQVLDAIAEKKQAEQQRDEARQEMQDVYLQAENMELEVERLKDQLKSRPQHEVVREVVPEETQRRISELEHLERIHQEDNVTLRRQLESVRKELDRAKGILNMGESTREVQNDAEYLVAATNQYVRRYGGLTWTVERLSEIDEITRTELKAAVKNLATFSNALMNSLEEM